MENRFENQLDELLNEVREDYYNTNNNNNIYFIFLLTALVSNIIGTVANIILFKLSITSIVCIVFSVLIIISTIIFKLKNKAYIFVRLSLYSIMFLEIPFLYISYREATIPYLILGIYSMLLLFKNKKMFICLTLLVIIYLSTISISYFYPDIYNEIDKASIYASLFTSLVISVVAILVTLYLLLSYNDKGIKELNELTKKIERVNHYDSLVPCYNRKYAVDYLESISKSNSSIAISLVLLDIENLHEINEQYGYQIGDDILVNFSQFAFNALKGRGFVSRFGGTKFLLILNVTIETEINRLLNEMIEDIKNYYQKLKNEDLKIDYAVTICKNRFSVDDEVVILTSSLNAKQKKKK